MDIVYLLGGVVFFIASLRMAALFDWLTEE